jgi:anti-anti-sigma factor
MCNNGGVAGELALHGRMTVENAVEMRAALSDALRGKPPVLQVDLSDVSYIDTAAVATLLEAARIARKQGNVMVLDGLRGQPRYFLEATHLDHLFDIAGPGG